jgi:hypothetical protein
MSNAIRKTKRAITEIQRERERVMDTLLPNTELIAGSYSEMYARCGKTGCHCEKKPAHLVTRLGFMESGKVKTKLVRIQDRPWVSKMVQTYKNQKKGIGEVSKLNKKQVALLRKLIQLRNCRYE